MHHGGQLRGRAGARAVIPAYLRCPGGCIPDFLSEHGESALAALHQALDQHAGEIVALGECGFDARLADHDAQWQLFEAQLSMAREFSCLSSCIACVPMTKWPSGSRTRASPGRHHSCLCGQSGSG
ncbi:TatD family hydrolase [Cobetia marina]